MPKYLFVLSDEGLMIQPFLQAAERVMKWIADEFEHCIHAKYEQLHKRAKPREITKLRFTKPMIKPICYPQYKQFRDDRRDIMEALVKAIKKARISEALNVNTLRPAEDRFFTASGAMSPAGYSEMLWYIDDIVYRKERDFSYEKSSRRSPPRRASRPGDFGIA